MPTSVQAALLGVVQGLTEFLPVSSSAHLILARAFFGWDADQFGLAFDVACHVGTLIAVLVYFRGELLLMLAALPRIFQPGPARDQPDVSTTDRARGGAGEHDWARMIWLLAIGTVPAVVVGILFKERIEDHLRTPQVMAVTLSVGALLLIVAERVGTRTRSDGSLTMAEAFWLGCAQAVALVPGVSRSGATLTLALLLGLRRAEAARFIFLLAIPAILGAAASEGVHVLKGGLSGETAMLFLIGVVSSAVVGYLAVKYFIQYLASHSLNVFAWYRLALAATVVVWLLRA